MAYVVLARKYRPQILEDIVGQEHIVQTLRNAIKDNRIAQSFLFVGSRGIGKTSTARILAKILNCLKREKEDIVPCNVCDSCLEITNGTSFDVLEIDGASNRGIDEIRNLRENVKFKPTYGAYKIFVIDEVHMLTQEAFNALLKTLEEPPPHVKFIFATTEPHRILTTIVSRCQRFDFVRIPTKTIVSTLKEIAHKEKIEVDDDALFSIAKAAEGSLRDGESILDQLASYARGTITNEAAGQILGFTKEETYCAIIDALIAKNTQEALTIVQKVVHEGKDIQQFVKGLLEFLRDMMMVSATNAPEQFVDRPVESIAAITKRVRAFSIEELLYSVTIVQNLLNQMRYSTFPQIYAEIALVKLAYRADMVAVKELLKRLEKGGSCSVPSSAPIKARIVRAAESSVMETGKESVAHPEKKEKASSHPDDRRISESSSVPVASQVAVSFSRVEESWNAVLAEVKKKRMSLGVFLSEAEPIELEAEILTLGFPIEFSFHKETLDAKDNKLLVEEAIHTVLGAPVRVKYVVTKKETREEIVAGGGNEHDHHAKIIESAVSLFQGKTVRRSRQ